MTGGNIFIVNIIVICTLVEIWENKQWIVSSVDNGMYQALSQSEREYMANAHIIFQTRLDSRRSDYITLREP